MDEPTEGLAPVIVEQVADDAEALAAEGEIAVLLIEQNLGVAIDVADTVDVMVNGRIARSMPAARARRRPRAAAAPARRARGRRTRSRSDAPRAPRRSRRIRRGARSSPCGARADDARVEPARRRAPTSARAVRGFTRWNAADPQTRPRDRLVEARAEPPAEPPSLADAAAATRRERPRRARGRVPGGGERSGARPTSPARSTPRAASSSSSGAASRSSACARSPSTSRPRASRRRRWSIRARSRATIRAASAPCSPATAAPRSTEMAVAFAHFVTRRRDLGGLISAGGSGGTALATRGDAPAAGRRAEGDGVDASRRATCKPYVGPSDICMMYSVTDIVGHQPHLRAGARERGARARRA